jgi:hypothetical protein
VQKEVGKKAKVGNLEKESDEMILEIWNYGHDLRLP